MGFLCNTVNKCKIKKNLKLTVINPLKRIFVMLVEKYIKEFKKYCKDENQKILFWLDEF